MAFRVGQKVVCIVDAAAHIQRHYPGSNFPQKGGIYTISTIGADSKGALLTFCELSNSHLIGKTLHDFYISMEPGFGAEHFRPIVERKTDISIFTKMLTGKRKPAHA